MRASQVPEHRRRAWAFAFISAVWVGATVVIVWHLMPKADRDVVSLAATLNRNTSLIEDQQVLMESYENLSHEIRSTQFQVYQMYVVSELRDQVNAIEQPNTPVEVHAHRLSGVLKMLINVREEHVAKQRNLVRIAEQVQNCREGNQDAQVTE